MGVPEPKCPLRRGDFCSLCWPGATGPANCGLVWLNRDDGDAWDASDDPVADNSPDPLDRGENRALDM